MEFTEIKELLALFNESSVREFNLQGESFQLYLNKNETSQQAAAQAAAPAPVAAPVATVASDNPAPAAPAPVVEVAASGKTVDSPIVGVAYLSSGPDEPVFKKVGDTVSVGDTLCIVEAMKIMNEITSDLAGTVSEVLIKNEDVVEYGQPLFRIV